MSRYIPISMDCVYDMSIYKILQGTQKVPTYPVDKTYKPKYRLGISRSCDWKLPGNPVTRQRHCLVPRNLRYHPQSFQPHPTYP
ncbi:hypothetical protein ACN38_g934 [Penicillium nordicum]|uniref:Uncharacterized protein n=1 Tax=Penicillium nordicum TaxID=229535 RepID=A0A0M8P9V9_9EURO|nr:hypothetical protein ACN38_g934 [Penicillium nordicum]